MVSSPNNTMMNDALAIRASKGVKAAISFLERAGISPELAVIALVGYGAACRNYGVERTDWRAG